MIGMWAPCNRCGPSYIVEIGRWAPILPRSRQDWSVNTRLRLQPLARWQDGAVNTLLLLMAMVLECWSCPRHADRQGCAVLAMLLLVMMVPVC